MLFLTLFVISTIGNVLCVEYDYKGFDDSIIFGLNWPGSPLSENSIENDLKPENSNFVVVTSSDHEKYKCYLPEVHDKESTDTEHYEGPSPITLLYPLFNQKICSYRLESYWSYEVCHGRYIRQYHEERDGKQVKSQEYFLGHMNTDREDKLDPNRDQGGRTLQTTQVEGMTLPYIEIIMEEGTVCDLNGKPRMTRVLYVCYIHGKHEVYSFKELATCQYEMIILSPLLCEHPHFKPKDKGENAINCVPLEGAPKKPRQLLKNEVENIKLNHQSSKVNSDDDHARDVLAVLKVEKIEQDGETHLKLELHPINDEDNFEKSAQDARSTETPGFSPITDDSPVRAFLNGETCLNGGSGWWKYEFCYGRHVVQYHVDRTGQKTLLMLGQFDERAHINWVKENPERVQQDDNDIRTTISHFYSNGDICDKIEKPRQTEVKLKCVKNPSSPAQVSLYLLEPRTCHYILGVESPLICDILPHVDEYGLVKPRKSSKSKSSSVPNAQTEEGRIKDKYVNKIGFD